MVYSGDLNSQQVWYLNGWKQFAHPKVIYSSLVLNNELKVCYSNGQYSDGPNHLILDRLYNELKVCYSNGQYSDGPNHLIFDHLNSKLLIQ